MHAALHVPEVLSLVFNDDSLSRATVLNMALTCLYWHEIAMEVLWRELPSLVPLFMLMPEDAWCAPRGERTPLEPIRFVRTHLASPLELLLIRP